MLQALFMRHIDQHPVTAETLSYDRCSFFKNCLRRDSIRQSTAEFLENISQKISAHYNCLCSLNNDNS